MRKVARLTLGLALTAALSLGTGGTALAHGGHGSCGGVVQEVLDDNPFGRGPGPGPSGAFVAQVAKSAPGGAADFVATAHLGYCDPHP